MRLKNGMFVIGILIMFLGSSCVGGKYTYEFDSGKELDFSTGKWILNNVQSNSKIRYSKKLYEESYEEFKKILGDSLIDLIALRNSSLVGPDIKFEPLHQS